MSPSLRQQVLRKIPSVDEILSRPEMVDLLKIHPRPVVVEAVTERIGTTPRRDPPERRTP